MKLSKSIDIVRSYNYHKRMSIDQAVKKLRRYYVRQKRLPSYQEMADLFGYKSKNASLFLAKKLIEAGILGKDEKGKLFPRKLFAIPHLGTIKAGLPMPAFDAHDDSIDIYNFLHDVTGDVYFLTVSGDSMIEAHIEEGDRVIVDKNKEPRDGDIVAAVVDNEWTIKYLEKRNGSVALVPANKKYPIIYPKESLFIGGVVISVIRKYH